MAINVFTASGNVGKDMEVRQTPNGKSIGQFSLPVKNGWGDNEKTSWVTCKMFGERAEKLQQHITKGTKLTVTGAFVLDEWEKDGVKHSRPTILVNDFEFGGSAQGQQNQYGYQQQRQSPQQKSPQGNQNRTNPPANSYSQSPEPDFDFDDD